LGERIKLGGGGHDGQKRIKRASVLRNWVKGGKREKGSGGRGERGEEGEEGMLVVDCDGQVAWDGLGRRIFVPFPTFTCQNDYF
jgi:hypothetical protein